ncbi:hypothetical protein [Novosphingobium sp. Gsoil 351]|uniref:hypothetical protein n=1 Tax=Novosphingobium sp. Gsoil 351 TaxID=2675225 RepID=UPI0012B45B64|nr:hypothetical protein [Novosphingobium sp. Gsoil 351]QGN56116.1 hypothetical protein GKE62_17755 [Novosphingobium sp. Gsoil 351]
MSRPFTTLCAVALGMIATSPALAATVLFTGGSSALDGTNGNVRAFSSGGISVQASAWTWNNDVLEQAYLGYYSSGLGVTSNSDGTGASNNSHTVDNVGPDDFILLVFNQLVNISSARLTQFDVSSTIDDNDATVSYATVANAFVSPTPATVPINSPLFGALQIGGALQNNDYTVSGHNSAPYDTMLNSAGLVGNV